MAIFNSYVSLPEGKSIAELQNELCQDQWIEDWAMLARRYQNWPHVGGFDLRNEVSRGPETTRGPEAARQFPPGLSL